MGKKFIEVNLYDANDDKDVKALIDIKSIVFVAESRDFPDKTLIKYNHFGYKQKGWCLVSESYNNFIVRLDNGISDFNIKNE